MEDLSILIPSRNEIFLKQTIDDILAHIEADTEIIAVLDGTWPEVGYEIPDHERVTLVYHPESIGQRAATNEAAKMARGKYIMKSDAHCAFDQGFDRKLMECIEYDWTVIPRQYNLHGFDWQCKLCGNRMYQGPYPQECIKRNRRGKRDETHICPNTSDFEMVVVWQPRMHRRIDFAYFDSSLHYQPMWHGYEERPEAQGDIADVMCCVGACWMMHKNHYWDLGGLDEAHGSWGQMGVEIACKSWLSGGRQVVNKRTWYSHMYRTQKGFGFPYEISGAAQEAAREYSRDLWTNNKWSGAVRTFDWLIDKFSPVPGWEEETI